MKGLILAAIITLATIGSIYIANNFKSNNILQANDAINYDTWIHWKERFNKHFSSDEDAYRYKIFKENMDFINQHQMKFEAGLELYSLSINEFAHLSNDEFKKSYNSYKPSKNREDLTVEKIPTDNLPETVDWRDKNVVTPVKNQGHCGSCWAFSTTGSLESIHAIKKGSLQSYSEQQLVDCSTSYGNNGCQGGLMDNAFKYIEAHGITLESNYPYSAKNGKCHYKSSEEAFRNKGYHDVTKNDSLALKAAVNQQPVSIAIDASCFAFQFYHSGVFTTNCGTNLDHGVLAVGYGTYQGTEYWLVKNSWGPSWGLNGYIRVLRSDKSGPGNLGIQMQPSYPTI